MRVVVSHPTGNANVRAVLRGLQQHDLLARFHTALALPQSSWLRRVGAWQLERQIGQRVFLETPRDRIVQHPAREVVRLAAQRLGLDRLTAHEVGWASVDGVYSDFDRRVAHSLRLKRDDVRAVYAYEDGASKTFEAAHRNGTACIYDLPIAHWRTLRRLLNEEADRKPEWTDTMSGLRDSPEKLARKDAEIEQADKILVASSFTRDSVTDHFGTDLDIITIPYGCPAPIVLRPAERTHGEPIRLFYAGHLSQRKGLADLIDALGRLDVPYHITVAGAMPAHAPAALTDFLDGPECTYLGKVPHATLLEEMSRANVFVFPSIVEGFGMVLTEAMACGLPIIATPHTAAPDLITDGREGFIVPIRDPDAIADRITLLAEDEDLRQAMAGAALDLAARSPWTRYEEAVAAVIRQAVEP